MVNSGINATRITATEKRTGLDACAIASAITSFTD